MRTKVKLALVTLAAATLLSACGGGGGGGGDGNAPSLSTVSGRVIDGYLVGAQVFWDCNDNFKIDEPAEPWVTTSAGGQYTIAKAPIASCVLRAVVPSWTVDESSGQTVGRTYRMSALAGNPAIISPVTTLITDGKYTLDQVRAMTGFTSAADTDYVAKGKDGFKDTNIAGVIAVGLMAVDGLVLAQDTQARGLTYRNLIERMPADSFFVSTGSVMPPSQLRDLLNGLPSWTPLQSAAPAMDLGLLDPALTGLCTDKLADGTQVPASDAVCEQRKTFIRGALGLAKRYFAVSGATIDWSKIPLNERRALAAAQTIPSNPAVDDVRAEMLAFTAKVNADIDKARGAFENAELIRIFSSAVDLTYRTLDLSVSAAELAPSGKGIRLVSSKFKSINAPIKLKAQFKAFWKSAGRLKLRDYYQLISSANCALKLESNVLSTWADVQDDSVDMSDEVVTYFVDTSICLMELINSPGKAPANDRLRKKDIFQKAAAATLGGIDFGYSGSNLKWTQADQVDFWDALDLALALAITASDTLEVPGLSAALKLVQMYPASMLAVAKGNVAGVRHMNELAAAMAKVTRDLDAYLNAYGRLFFAGRVNPYIGVDVLLDICSKNGVSIGRAWSPVSEQSSRVHALSAQRIQALGTGQTVTSGSAVTLAPGQRFFGAGAVNRYTWDFGDGSTSLVTTTPDEVSHIYASPGTYVVTLRTSSAGSAGVDGSDGERYEASVYADVRVDAASGEVKALVDAFVADGTTFGGMARIGADVYVASVQQDRTSILRNSDNTPFYKSSIALKKISNGIVQWTTPVATNVYMGSDPTQFSQTGVSVSRAGDAVHIAVNGFVGSGYGMKFGVYKVALANQAVTYTALFASANVGWYPWFSADDSVNHFAFSGYLRCVNAQCGAGVQPVVFVAESQNKVLASVGLPANVGNQNTNFKAVILGQLKAWLSL